MSVKINQLEIENVKRIKAVCLTPAENGLTVIGGNNNQGKTSVLDTICWALGGERYRPSNAAREGSTIPPHIRIELSNGIIVERAGKNSALKVTDPSGRKSGQQLLNDFVEVLAIDLPKFMQASSKEKADTLLQIIGVGDKLRALEMQEVQLYNQRRSVGQEADRKRKHAEEMPFFPDAPKDYLSITELVSRQQDILARNGENQRKRAAAEHYAEELKRAQEAFEAAKGRLETALANAEMSRRSALDLQDESTEALEQEIANFEQINRQVRTNYEREKAEEDARYYSERYDGMTAQLEQLRKDKYDLLHSAKLPLPELSVEDGELTYQGKCWDCMSGSDQLKAATAIVRAINPKCGFVLLDKLEQMDRDTLREFGQWLESEGLQAIATRVSTGSECSVIIEDGYSHAVQQKAAVAWKEGVF